MAGKWRPPAEKRYNAKKANVPRSQSALSADGMTARWTHTSRKALSPPWVDASTDPWRVIQVVTPPCAIRVKGGVQQDHVFDKHDQGEGGAEMTPSSKYPETVWKAPHQVPI